MSRVYKPPVGRGGGGRLNLTCSDYFSRQNDDRLLDEMISRGVSALHACSAACTLYSTAVDSNIRCLAFTYQVTEPDPVTREAANLGNA